MLRLFFGIIFAISGASGKIRCTKKMFALSNLPPIRLENKAIPVRVKADCDENVLYKFQLSYEDISGKIIQVPNAFKEEKETKDPVNYLTIAKIDKNVPLYLYWFQITVSINSTESKTPWSISKEFLVTPHAMDVIIAGGPKKMLGSTDQFLILDASNSKDESFPPGTHKMADNKINWACRPPINYKEGSTSIVWKIPTEKLTVSNYNCSVTITRTGTPNFPESAAASYQLIEINADPLQFTCIENCGTTANLKKKTVFEWKCLRDCTNRITFRVDNLPKNRNQPREKHGQAARTIYYDPDTFQAGDDVRFVAVMGKNEIAVNVSYRTPKPKFKIVCQEPCSYDPRIDVSLTAKCETECVGERFRWVVNKCKDFCSENSCDKEPIQSNIKFHQIGKDPGESVVIFAESAKEFETITITARIYEECEYQEFRLRKLSPKLNLTCIIDGENVTECNPEPHDNVTIVAECVEHCYLLSYTWDLTPTPKGFQVSDNVSPTTPNQVIIPSNTFNNGSSTQVTVLSASTAKALTITYIEKRATVKIICMENCEGTSNVYKPITVRAECLEHCTHITYSWEVTNQSPSLVRKWQKITDGHTFLTIPAKRFVDGDKVTVKLMGKSARDELVVNLFEPKTKISIECKRNCNIPADAVRETLLEASCVAEENICDLIDFSWEASPLNELAWQGSVNFNERKTTALIRPGTFQDGQQITFKVKGGKGTAEMSMKFKENMPELELECFKNCFKTQVVFVTSLLVKCIHFCEYVDYVWKFEPSETRNQPVRRILYNDDRSIIHIQPNSFKGGDIITVIVTSGKSSATKTLTFNANDPVLEITCEPKCEQPLLNPLKTVKLSAKCWEFCVDTYSYSWSLQNPPKDFIWTKKITNLIRNEAIVVAPEAFQDGDKITFIVKYGGSSQTKELEFVEPTPTISIICVENCWEGHPMMDTILNANCTEECENATRFVWELDPSPISFVYNTSLTGNNDSITIKGDTYKDRDKVSVTLKLGKGISRKLLNFIEVPSNITVSCVDNCSPANPFKDVTLNVTCHNNCQYKKFKWMLEGAPSNFNYTEKVRFINRNTTLTIKENAFTDGNIIDVIANNGKSNKTYQVSFEEPKADLAITCTENCQSGVSNRLKPMILRVVCSKNCYRETYEWTLSPGPPGIDWTKFVTGKNENTFKVFGNIYRDDSSTSVMVNNSKTIAQMDIRFTEPTPTIQLSCSHCPNPRPDERITFTVKCITECEFLQYVWDIDLKKADFSWKNNTRLGRENQTLTIRENTYANKDKVTITVYNLKGKASMRLMYKNPPAVLKIVCVDNCPDPDPDRDLTVEVICKYDCQDKEYKWSAYPIPQKSREKEDHMRYTILKGTFYADSEVYIKVTSGELSAMITLTLKEKKPEIGLFCDVNCEYNPKEMLIFHANCTKYCEGLKYKWTLEPKPWNAETIKMDSSTLEIKSFSYDANRWVKVTVRAHTAVKSMKIRFTVPYWEGECTIEPNKGISGETLFQIECDDFKEDAMIRVYHDEYLLLYFIKSQYSESFWLSETTSEDNSDVKIVIGDGWLNVKEIPVPMTVSSFFQDAKDPIEKENMLKKRLLGGGPTDYNYLMTNGKHTEVVHLAAVLNTALDHIGNDQRIHYKNHILKGIVKSVLHLDTMISFLALRRLATDKELNMESIQLIFKGLERACHNAKMKDSNYNKVLNNLLSSILHQKSELIHRIEEMKKNNVEEIDPDYESYVEMTNPNDVFKDAAKRTMFSMLKFIECFGNLQIEPMNLSTDIITTTIDWLRLKKPLVPIALLSDTQQSFFNISIQLQQQLINLNVTKYQVTTFSFNPFLWDHIELTTDVLHLKLTKIDTLNHPIDVVLETKTKPRSLGGTVTDKIIYEFQVQPLSLFTAKFYTFGNVYRVSLSDGNSSKMHTRTNYKYINKSDETWSIVSETNNVYVTIQGDGKSTTTFEFEYISDECFYWRALEIKWRKEECVPQSRQGNQIRCQCTHLSLFAGRSKIPQNKVYNVTSYDIAEVHRINIVPIITGISLFLFLCILGYTMIKNIKRKSEDSVNRFIDNVSKGQEIYVIGIITGFKSSAATTANVFLKIHGEFSTTDAFSIKGRQKEIPRNSELFFTMPSAYLGKIKQVEIWHDSKGKKPFWFCERIMIEHVESREIFHFMVEKSLGVLQGMGKTRFIIPVAKEIPSLTYGQRIRESFRIYQNLFSLFMQRPRFRQSSLTVVVGFATFVVLMVSAFYLQKRMGAISGGFLASLIAFTVGFAFESLIQITCPLRKN